MAFIGNYNTHDNILIFSKDPEILDHMIGSVKYKIVDEVGNTTETAYSDVNPTSSISDNGTENITGIDSTGTNAQTSSSTSVPSGYYWSGQDADYCFGCFEFMNLVPQNRRTEDDVAEGQGFCHITSPLSAYRNLR